MSQQPRADVRPLFSVVAPEGDPEMVEQAEQIMAAIRRGDVTMCGWVFVNRDGSTGSGFTATGGTRVINLIGPVEYLKLRLLQHHDATPDEPMSHI